MNDVGSRLDGPPTGEGDESVPGRTGEALRRRRRRHRARHDDRRAPGADGHAVRRPRRPRAGARLDRGFRIAVHAMGNRGVQAMIDVCADRHPATSRDRPPVPRRARGRRRAPTSGAGSPTSARSQWCSPGSSSTSANSSGGVRFDHHHWLAFAGLAEAGVMLAGSSDDPCAPPSPLWGAARRVPPHEPRGPRLRAGTVGPVRRLARRLHPRRGVRRRPGGRARAASRPGSAPTSWCSTAADASATRSSRPGSAVSAAFRAR